MTTSSLPAEPISDDELPRLFAGLEQTPLAVAVSGGADSMALMHLVARWAAREDVLEAWAAALQDTFDRCHPAKLASGLASTDAIRPPWNAEAPLHSELPAGSALPHVVILTVNHGLRPEAAREAAFVEREAASLGLPCTVLRWEGEKPATGIQEAARTARRDLMLDLLAAEDRWLDAICGISEGRPRRRLLMAHHLDDQAETVLMRLARGSGLDGLSGMRPSEPVMRSPIPQGAPPYNSVIERPLLGLQKARLVATLKAHHARWIEDPSNEDERFERVRIRKAMDGLVGLGFTPEKIALSARRLQQARRGVTALAEAVRREQGDAPASRGLYDEIDIDEQTVWFAGEYVGVRTLRQLIGSYGGAAPEAELSQLEALYNLVIDEQARVASGGVTLGGCKIEFLGGHGARIRIYREGKGEGLAAIRVQPGQSVRWDGGRFLVTASAAAPEGALVQSLGMAGWAAVKRAVPVLEDLRWPAAAAATLPVVALAGQMIACPAIASLISRVPGEQHRARQAWAAWDPQGATAHYSCVFSLRAW